MDFWSMGVMVRPGPGRQPSFRQDLVNEAVVIALGDGQRNIRTPG